MSEGWKCPNSGKAHGPHVDTCPGGGTEGLRDIVIPKSFPAHPPFPYQTQKLPLCGCELGTVCGNAACPHRMVVTCETSNSTGMN